MEKFLEDEVYKAAKQHYTSAEAAVENIERQHQDYFLSSLTVDEGLNKRIEMVRLFNRIKEK